ncbi:hypothetical protein FNL55_13115 [Tardiphaga sp. vice352]|uniref:hypothetical protein n=1 Tax=Tardiphaga sp. vice352 TaxID=2592816 RepID=UPI001165B03F|nr:hypothetical protein [Tardiphaga sp. vice352]QDM32171.1 hypothetical protein FNL55_13115 [Tardiphaga sp. vice352]
MNAQTLLKYLPWHTSEPGASKPAVKEFPPEAYSYDSPITKQAVAGIQQEANKTLDKQQWTVIERLGDGCER